MTGELINSAIVGSRPQLPPRNYYYTHAIAAIDIYFAQSRVYIYTWTKLEELGHYRTCLGCDRPILRRTFGAFARVFRLTFPPSYGLYSSASLSVFSRRGCVLAAKFPLFRWHEACVGFFYRAILLFRGKLRAGNINFRTPIISGDYTLVW